MNEQHARRVLFVYALEAAGVMATVVWMACGGLGERDARITFGHECVCCVARQTSSILLCGSDVRKHKASRSRALLFIDFFTV